MALLRFTALLIVIAFPVVVSAQEENLSSPPLYFREDWCETPAETPVTQDHVLNSGLELALHGSGKDMIKKSHHDQPLDDPFYIWSGQCEGTWAVSLAMSVLTVDLTRGSVRWRTKNFDRILRVVVGLADGTWLVSSRGTGETPGWHDFTIDLTGMTWKKLNIGSVTAGDTVDKPDLTRVRSVGFTDLDRGGQSLSCSRLDWIEVYGRKK
ncbi:hypothetical protein ACFL47_07390 [Candidatus Latescibacterota bacterium]